MIIDSFDKLYLEIDKICTKKKSVSIMLTGGNSIIKFYKYLSKKIDMNFLKKVNFFLSDERIFENKKNTNYHQVRKTLFKKFKDKDLKFTKFYDEKKTVEENLTYFEKKLNVMDIIFLSYGNDGHIASLFPNLKPKILKKKVCFVCNKKNKYKFRISVSMNYIKKSKHKFLFFLGDEKKKIYKKLEKNSLINNTKFKKFKIVVI